MITTNPAQRINQFKDKIKKVIIAKVTLFATAQQYLKN
jgi:hypothetical protein